MSVDLYCDLCGCPVLPAVGTKAAHHCQPAIDLCRAPVDPRLTICPHCGYRGTAREGVAVPGIICGVCGEPVVEVMEGDPD